FGAAIARRRTPPASIAGRTVLPRHSGSAVANPAGAARPTTPRRSRAATSAATSPPPRLARWRRGNAGVGWDAASRQCSARRGLEGARMNDGISGATGPTVLGWRFVWMTLAVVMFACCAHAYAQESVRAQGSAPAFEDKLPGVPLFHMLDS